MDTNVVIDFLGGKLPQEGNKWLQSIVNKDVQFLSVINKIELLGFNGADNEMQILEDFIGICGVLPLSNEIAEKTISLRKIHTIKLPDAIIAATALFHNLTLITRNSSDFKNIEGLNYMDAHTV